MESCYKRRFDYVKENKGVYMAGKSLSNQKRLEKLRTVFYIKANAFHNNSFLYCDDYKNSQTKIRIKCKIHGYFYQTPAEHLRSRISCPKCSGNVKLTTEEFVLRCKKIHGSKYSYDKTHYKGANSHVVVTCKEHGDFNILASSHVNGKQGCRACGYNRSIEKRLVTSKEFISRHRKIHDNIYTYEKTLYTKSHDKVTVTCSKHGDFSFSAYTYAGCPGCGVRTSDQQNKVIKFLKKNGFNPQCNSIVDGTEYDVYLPDQKLAIEINGVYWHTEQYGKSRLYHYAKTKAARKSGISLIHLWDYEIINKPSLVRSMILAKLGMFKTRMYARKLEVRQVSSIDANNFIEKNHLQGKCRSIHCTYALFDDEKNELVSVMAFGKPRFTKNAEWEIIRFCTKKNYQVIGGAARLLKAFRNDNSGSIVSYANLRFSQGGLYETLGFRYFSRSAPNYSYAKGGKLLSRYQAQKHRLPKLLGDSFDSGKSEKENMERAGYFRVWDCGNLVYTLE